MEQKFYDAMADCPVIAAVKNVEGIERCLESDVKIVFVLFGNLCSISGIVERVKEENAIEWTGKINNIRACAREIVNEEIIFA